MALSDASIRALKTKDSPYSVTDEKGLSLQISAGGSKLWRFRYQFGGKARILSFGSYPEVPLAEARRRREGDQRDRAGFAAVAQGGAQSDQCPGRGV